MEKKNTGLIILVIILSLLVLGLGGFIVYDKVINNDDVKTEEKENNTNKDNDKNNVNSNINEVKTISRESIIELSKNTKLNINTNFNNIDKLISDNLYLSINDNNKLILKHNNNYSVISNLDEDVVMIYDANDSCQIETGTFLILTSNGNIYSYEKEYYKSDEYIKSINNKTSVNIPLTKINGSNKVLAFTNHIGQSEEPITCGSYPPIVYIEDGNFMEIDLNNRTLKEYNF